MLSAEERCENRLLQVVIDTNVLIAALQSKVGASFNLLRRIGTGQFVINLSVPLCLEYESVAKRIVAEKQLPLTNGDIEELIEMLTQAANLWQIRFLWRPFLPDPNDEMLLELAFTANCDFIVTYNLRDFRGVKENFGIEVITPKQFIQWLDQKNIPF